ncbi:MAG: hypothetical protein M3R01_09535, partial [Actinomycetota bacterium]|nr:hypothetical protein [Actinomycetota bacterium]
RLTVLVLVGVLGFVGTACDPALSRKTSGTFTGTTTFQFSTGGCSFVQQRFDGSWVRRQGAPGGTFELIGCVGSSSTFPYRGTFLLMTQGGAELRGTVSGTVGAAINPAPLDFELTVTDATKRFRGATGTIVFDGRWFPGEPFMGPNPISGSLVAVLQDANGQAIAL